MSPNHSPRQSVTLPSLQIVTSSAGPNPAFALSLLRAAWNFPLSMPKESLTDRGGFPGALHSFRGSGKLRPQPQLSRRLSNDIQIPCQGEAAHGKDPP